MTVLVLFTSMSKLEQKEYTKYEIKWSYINKSVDNHNILIFWISLTRNQAASTSSKQGLVSVIHEVYLGTLSTLTKLVNPEDPTDCFDQFLGFHDQIVEATTDMISIKAATETTNKEENAQILHEIHIAQSHCCISGKKSSKVINLGKNTLDHQELTKRVNWDHVTRTKTRIMILSNFGKQIEIEAGNWFMEFLEKALEKGMKKTKSDGKKVPQSLIMKVLNWVEVEQCDSSKRPVHPRAIAIARKLRIKVKTT